MTVKELKELYDGINKRLELMELAIINHTGQHGWDKVISYGNSALLIIVILLLKFKIL